MSGNHPNGDVQPPRRYWTKRRVGLVLILIGVVPTFVIGVYSSFAYYVFRDSGVPGPEAAREALIRTWNVGKYLWGLLPVGMVVYLLGLMEEAPPKRHV